MWQIAQKQGLCSLDSPWNSHDILTCTLIVFNLDVYTLLDQLATRSFITSYIIVNFDVSTKTHSEGFSDTTQLGETFITRRVKK